MIKTTIAQNWADLYEDLLEDGIMDKLEFAYFLEAIRVDCQLHRTTKRRYEWLFYFRDGSSLRVRCETCSYDGIEVIPE